MGLLFLSLHSSLDAQLLFDFLTPSPMGLIVIDHVIGQPSSLHTLQLTLLHNYIDLELYSLAINDSSLRWEGGDKLSCPLRKSV